MHTAIGNLLGASARSFGTKNAVVTNERTLTFAELDRLSTRFAAGLAELGVQSADRVTLWLDNGWRWVVAYYGILRCGAVVNPANGLSTISEVLYMTQDCDSKLVIARRAKASGFAAYPSVTVLADDDGLIVDKRSFDGLLERGAAALHHWRPPTVDSRDLCSIFYTSGTTGFPKGAAIRHESMLLNVAMTSLMHGMHADDTVVTPLPSAHVYGNVVLNSAVACGMTLVLLPRYDEREILESVERFRATILTGVPSMYLALMNIADIDRFDLGSLRICTVGGQGMAVSKMKEVESRMRCPLIELWGMTEIAGLGATHPYNGPSNLGSIGIPLPFTEIRIADPNEPQRELPINEVGELLVRGPHVMAGYFNRPEDTAKAIEAGGWLHSGDLVRRDERGYLYLVDRIKDVILSGGYTIYPAEVERAISQHPAVSAALAIPVADDLRGQTIMVYVVLRPGLNCIAEDIIGHCRELLAAYKVPRRIEIVQTLPIGNTGKIVRRQMIDHLATK